MPEAVDIIPSELLAALACLGFNSCPPNLEAMSFPRTAQSVNGVVDEVVGPYFLTFSDPWDS